MCLGVRYVVYTDSSGKALSTKDQAAKNIAQVNQTWAQCGIEFQIDSYEEVDPGKFNLAYDSQAQNQLDQIRNTFNDGQSLLVVFTGPWGTVKNAWTSMPGSAPYGAVFESTVADYPQIVAHELGHYLGLDHVADNSNVMDAIIYPDSVQLTQDQCNLAQQTAQKYWKTMMR